ncbi:hypothetical protein GGF37_002129 [Kickxella alabastrina]|nr:hypothetical protein GGF37_002129 [Kickxella alabastrina]
MHQLQQNAYGQQQQLDCLDTLSTGTVLPSLLTCPSELLTRRLSTLTLGNNPRNVLTPTDTQSQAVGNGPSVSVGLPNPHPLDRRPSAGVIGQRRLSTKPSFLQQQQQQQPAAHSLVSQKSSSQLSFANLWQQTSSAGDYPHSTLSNQLGDYQGALSTPASSVHQSTSSLSLLTMTPSMNKRGSISTGETSRRQSSEDQSHQKKHDEFGHFDFTLGNGNN